ncbi:MAG: hemolysin family protein [Acidobacteriaceae bacterium]
MIIFWIILLALLSTVLALASYIERIYGEAGKLLSREFEQNIEVYEERIEPKLRSRGPSRRLSGAMGLLAQLCNTAITLVLAYFVFSGPFSAAQVAQLAIALVLILLTFNRLVPFLLFTRTRGVWLVRFTPLLRIMMWVIFPVTLALSFCMSIAALAEKREREAPETPQEAVEALIEAGEEEGILEESDRELIHSVVEFGDKITREVMTPRPDVFAVRSDTTIEAFHELLRERPHTRVPAYKTSLEDIEGIIFTPDLLQVRDSEAGSRTVGTLLRPAYFVPETKPTMELLRELQRQKSHIAIVIDEYGGVTGVVSVEDLVEEIVGELHDERESNAEAVKQADGSYIVFGTLDIGRLEDIFGFRPEDEHEVETSTVGGLVIERLGHIPRCGERLEESGLRFEVLKSTDRRIEKLRISRIAPRAENEDIRKVTA